MALAARRARRLQSLAEQINISGAQALVVQTDVSQLEMVERMAKTVLDQWGQIDVLFNNAGFGRFDWLENLDAVQDVQAD